MAVKPFIKSLKIGSVEISNNVVMAPLAGISDFPFRKLVRSYGACLTFTEMISINAFLQQPNKTRPLLNIRSQEHPVGIQLVGGNPNDVSRIIPNVEIFGPDVIDINFGCPVKKVIRTGGGATLLKDADKIYQIMHAASQSATVPVTAKIRLGWNDKAGLNEIVSAVVEGGASAITVHGRTWRQAYSGEVDLEAMAAVKEQSPVPVIGNGNIFNAESAEKVFRNTGVDGIMLARGTFGNPALFREILSEQNMVITAEERMTMLMRHYELAITEYGEPQAIFKMRKVACWYLDRVENTNHLKRDIVKAKNLKEVKRLLKELGSR